MLKPLPPYPIKPTSPAPVVMPTSRNELGSQHGLLFAAMHRQTAELCVRAGALLSLRELAVTPGHKVLGYPEGIRRRLRAPLPAPYQGRVGDAVSLTVTPYTLAAFGSYRPIQDSGAEHVPVGDMAVAIVSCDDLIACRLPMVFSDRSPIKADSMLTEAPDLDTLPWERIRNRRLSPREGDPLEAARYEAELLVWGCVPLALVRLFAVHDQAAADSLRAVATASGHPTCTIEVQPIWFFGS